MGGVARLAITQVKSGIGAPKKVRRTLEALGLRHQRTVLRPDNPAVRGMLFRVRHLVRVEVVGDGEGARGGRRRAASGGVRTGGKTAGSEGP